MKLQDIATLIAGYTFRGAIIPDKNGGCLVFQAKDLVRDESVTNTTDLTPIALDSAGSNSYLQSNDVLVAARGMKTGAFRSTVYKSDAANVIASSSVHIIRLTCTNVLPEYVSHYLNSKHGQAALLEGVTGSYIGMLPRKTLGQIEMPIPEIKKQKMVVDLYQNIQMQKKILDRRNELNQQIFDEIFTKLTTHHD